VGSGRAESRGNSQRTSGGASLCVCRPFAIERRFLGNARQLSHASEIYGRNLTNGIPATILTADDHVIFSDGLRLLLETRYDIVALSPTGAPLSPKLSGSAGSDHC